MKITITPDGYICNTHEQPIEGRQYVLEDSETHTAPQRKAAHALISEWFKSGLWDFVDTMDYNRFRDEIKKRYGAGFFYYEYVDDSSAMQRVTTVEEIPDYALDDFNSGNSGRIKGVLKSFTRYKKSEVMNLIDRLIDAMNERGVNSAKYADILAGLNDGI